MSPEIPPPRLHVAAALRECEELAAGLTGWRCGTSRRVEAECSKRIISTAARAEWVTNFLAAAWRS